MLNHIRVSRSEIIGRICADELVSFQFSRYGLLGDLGVINEVGI